MILLIDNYDSFVFNLARCLMRLGAEVRVCRNDAIDAAGVRRLRPQAVVLSPGPCTPHEAGCSLELVRRLHEELPLLGVCLGHQTIAAALGGQVVRATEPMHGRTSLVRHDGRSVFRGLPSPLSVCRYHSLAVRRDTLPAELESIAELADGTIMALAHRTCPTVGVQFHPEAILTDGGYAILANFLELAGVPLPEERPSVEQERPPTPAPRVLPEHPVTF